MTVEGKATEDPGLVIRFKTETTHVIAFVMSDQDAPRHTSAYTFMFTSIDTGNSTTNFDTHYESAQQYLQGMTSTTPM